LKIPKVKTVILRNKEKIKIGQKEKKVYSVSSSVADSTASAALVVSSTGAPLAARLATTPSLVTGVYAPPANVKSHLLHFQMPTLSRLTRLKPHCGHLWGFLSSVITLM
jgi:hypothetical protein